MSKGVKADLNFKLGQPYRPYEQHMGVLPDRSKKIVPIIYHELMTDPKSPIIDFYPRDFELDMNGKKMEWEAVVKIPFIDEKRLLSAMAPKNALLSADEKARNDFGVSIKFSFDSSITPYTYPSSMVGVFPDVPNCRCVENIYDLPTSEGLELYRGLLDGAKLNVEALAGFPSLATLPYTASLDFHGVKVFNQESRNQSMVVTLTDAEMRSNIESAKYRLGQKCHVGYPFLQEAKIMRITDRDFEYALDSYGSGQITQRELSGNEKQDWQKKAAHLVSFYSKRLGIVIGNVESIAHVDMLKGLVKTKEGALVKEYGYIPGAQVDHATQLVVDEVISEDQRFIEKEALPLEEEFPEGSLLFYLGDTTQDSLFYGRPARVKGHANDRVETIMRFHQTKNAEPKPEKFVPHEQPFSLQLAQFAKPIVQQADYITRYEPGHAIAKQLGIAPLLLSRITASYFVYTVGDLRVNLGLNLKFEAKKLKVLGYSRKSDRGWEYSQAAKQLIIQYAASFPDLFAGLMQNPHGNEIHEKDIFPHLSTEQATIRVKEIVAWLKTVETKKFEKVPLDAEQLDSNVVLAIERSLDSILATLEETKGEGRWLPRKASRNGLLRIEDAEQRLGTQKFQLGDRVLYASGAGKATTGAEGVVVGISTVGNHHMLDIVFDHAFLSGTNLGERCSPFRGATVSAKAVLNLSNKQLFAAAVPNNSGKGKTTSTYAIRGGHSNGLRAHDGSTYRDAPAPGPLQGSFRGAINGANGAPQLQPANLVYRPAPQGQTAQGSFRGHPTGQRGGRGNRAPQAGHMPGQTPEASQVFVPGNAAHPVANGYNAVPPPASLLAKNNSRGRGGGRGRGQGGRGQGGGRGASRGGRGRGGARSQADPPPGSA